MVLLRQDEERGRHMSLKLYPLLQISHINHKNRKRIQKPLRCETSIDTGADAVTLEDLPAGLEPTPLGTASSVRVPSVSSNEMHKMR